MPLVPSDEDERWKCLLNWNLLYQRIKDSSSNRLLNLSDDANDVLNKTNEINDSCSDAFAFSSEINGMWLQIVNVIDFAISWGYLVDSGFCTG